MSNTTEMKPFHILSCSMYHLAQMQFQVMEWVRSRQPTLLSSDSLWNKVNTPDLIRNTPALIEWCKTHDLKIREVALTVINQPVDADLHIDELPITAKINIPIQNTRGSLNRWYDIPEQMLEDTKPIVNEFGKKYYSFRDVDYSKLNMIGELELLGPVVFNSQIAHNIIIGEQCVLPRVVMSCTFFNEPIHYLQQ